MGEIAHEGICRWNGVPPVQGSSTIGSRLHPANTNTTDKRMKNLPRSGMIEYEVRELLRSAERDHMIFTSRSNSTPNFSLIDARISELRS